MELFKDGLKYPKCNDYHYGIHLAKLLNEYSNDPNKEFNIFTFSNLLFLLEKFTIEYGERKILESVNF